MIKNKLCTSFISVSHTQVKVFKYDDIFIILYKIIQNYMLLSIDQVSNLKLSL